MVQNAFSTVEDNFIETNRERQRNKEILRGTERRQEECRGKGREYSAHSESGEQRKQWCN
jgi:hypothetical protein